MEPQALTWDCITGHVELEQGLWVIFPDPGPQDRGEVGRLNP